MVFAPRFNTTIITSATSHCDYAFEQRLVVGRGHAMTCVRDSLTPTGYLNGEGDILDRVLQVYDLDSGSSFNHGISVTYTHTNTTDPKLVWAQNDNTLFFAADEGPDGRDYNGDGDTLDNVVHILR